MVRLPNAVKGRAQGQAEVRVALAAEDLAGREEDVRPVAQRVGEGVARPSIRRTRPDERTQTEDRHGNSTDHALCTKPDRRLAPWSCICGESGT